MADTHLYAKSTGNLATDLTLLGTTNAWRLVIKESPTTVPSALTVPANILIEVERGGKLQKSGSGTIQFLGQGLKDPTSRTAHFSGFGIGDITFTGANAPDAISAELWDTANSSLMDRWRRADTAFPSKRVKIILYPRSILATDRITSSEHRHVHFMPGEYQNAYTNYAATFKPPITFVSNFTMTFEPGVTLYTSSSNAGSNTALIRCDSETAQYENVKLDGRGCTIKGQSTMLTSGTMCIQLGNVKTGYIRHFVLDGVQDYGLCMGAYGHTGSVAEDCDISDNLIKNAKTTVLVAFHGRRLGMYRNKVYAHDTTSGNNNYNGIDIEPNTPEQFIEHLFIEDNEFYIGDISGASVTSYFNAIQVLATATNGIKTVHINRNKLNGSDIGFTGTDKALVGLNIEGVQDLHINDNEVKGWLNTSLVATKCRYGRISNNDFIRCGRPMELHACAEMIVAGNHLVKQVYGGGANTNLFASIEETEISYPLDASGTNAELTEGYSTGRVYSHFKDLPLKLNMAEITLATTTIAGVDYQKFTFSPSVGTPTGKTFTADAGTDVLTFSADNKMTTGERVTLSNSGGGLPGGLAAATTYFYIRLTSTTGKLATSFARAVAGTGAAIDITSAGTGTHTLTPQYLARKSFVSGDVNTGTETIALYGHNNLDGARLTYYVYGLLPTPLIGGYGQNYYIVGATTNTFQLSATSGGAAITLTDTGSGTHSIRSATTGIIAGNFTASGSTLTLNGHGFANGALVQLDSVGTAIGGLTNGQEVFAIASVDSVKLGSSEANALAETAINLTSTGAGLHTLTPTARTQFSSNTFIHNIAPDGINLEATGASVNYPLADYAEQIADLDARLTAIEPDPAFFDYRIADFDPVSLAGTYANGEQITGAWASDVGSLTFSDNDPTYPITFGASGVNGKPFVRVGRNHGMANSANLPGSPAALTVILVAKTFNVTSTGDYTMALNDGSSGNEGNWHISLAYNGEIRWWNAGEVGDAPYNLTDVQVLIAETNGTTAALYLNGTNITDDATKASIPTHIRIGDPTDAVISRGAGADFYRIIYLDAVLTTEERDEAIAHLANKYQ